MAEKIVRLSAEATLTAGVATAPADGWELHELVEHARPPQLLATL